MKSSQRKKEGEKEGQREGGETEKDTEQREHKAGREKHSKKKTLKALNDRNISVEINSKKKMRGVIYWKGKGLFGIGQNGFEKSIITVEIEQILKSKPF